MMKKNRRLDAFVEALLISRSVEEAATRVRISRATAHRWLKSDYVTERLAAARKDSMSRAIARLQEAAVQSVATLCEIQETGESESARVSAAKAILEQALRATELTDVIERLDVIERTIKSQPFTPPAPRISVSYEHEKDGKGSPNGQSSKTPPGGFGGSHEQ
jgi:hypothetical protein